MRGPLSRPPAVQNKRATGRQFSPVLGRIGASFNTDEAGKRKLSALRIFSGPLTHGFSIAANVEEIIDHLKGQTYIVAITFEAFKLLTVSAGNRPPQTERYSNHGSGLSTVNRGE